jgi:hypothetical protein
VSVERDKAVRQYLARYAAPEVALAASVPGDYAHVIVVPACAEDARCIAGLASAAREPVLAIVVVNGTEDADLAVHRANATLLAALADQPSLGALEVMVVDRASAGRRLPAGQGVGLARRIGCDLALALQVGGRVRSPWIHTTDADAVLADDYFDVPARAGSAAALVYPLWHEPSGEAALDRAHALYEMSLRYYVLGLHWAGSPYAYHTVGSALAVRGTAYAAVRGVPRRQAGEDFYLLNKLARLGPIAQPAAEPVRLRGRRSRRVPFGTGPACERIMAGLAAGQPFRVYHPRSFELLGDRLAAYGGADATRAWLDSFRTLKFIHAARAAGLADVPWEAAFSAAPFAVAPGPVADCRARLFARETAVLRAGPAQRASVRFSPMRGNRVGPGDRG